MHILLLADSILSSAAGADGDPPRKERRYERTDESEVTRRSHLQSRLI